MSRRNSLTSIVEGIGDFDFLVSLPTFTMAFLSYTSANSFKLVYPKKKKEKKRKKNEYIQRKGHSKVTTIISFYSY